MSKLKYVWDHRAELAAAFIAFATAYTIAVATPLSRLIKRPAPDAKWWKRALYDLFIDTPSWLAALERSGIFGGIFNVPGVPSRLPKDNPTPAASTLMRAAKQSDATRVMRTPGLLLPFLLALGFAGMLVVAAGCTGARALGSCELNTLPQQFEGLLARVVAAAFTSGVDWNAQLEQAAASSAPGQGACVAQAVAGWLEDLTGKRGQVAAEYAEAHRRMRAFLDTHPASACSGKVPRALTATIRSDQVLLRFDPAVPQQLWVGSGQQMTKFGGAGASTKF